MHGLDKFGEEFVVGVTAHARLLVHLLPSSTSGGEEQTLRNCARPIVIVTLREHAH